MCVIRRLTAALAAAVAVATLSGCASEGDLAVMRQPALPPLAVLKAERGREFYHNVVLQEITGAPEFRWFDGGAILTTRPTRVQIIRMLKQKLDNADMLAPTTLDARYLLKAHFNDLRGPDVVPGSEKLATASVTFDLIDRWHPDQIVLSKTVEASYRVRWIGVTPDAVRAFIAGPIGVTRDSAIAPVGGLIGGALLGYYLNDELVLQLAETPLAALYGADEARLTGGDAAAPYGFWSSFATALAVSTARGHYSDAEAAFAGGAILGVGAATGPLVDARLAADGEVSGYDGAKRRLAATQGLVYVAFEKFLNQLVPSGSVIAKRAVSCAHLNPDGYQSAFLGETETEYALDCPGAHFNER